MVDITYFKCANGYKAPAGFEWMKPTKVYFIFGNDTDNSGNYLNTITYNPYNIANGDDLTQINNTYSQQEGGSSSFLGNNFNQPYNYNVETFSFCIDCGLGYWATVQLLDNFIPQRDSRITVGKVGFPAQGFGYTCGHPTAEEALRVAWESAKKMLGKSPKAFNYEVGINAKPQEKTIYDKYRSTGSTLQYMSDYVRSDKNFGASVIPDNVDDFLYFVKQRKKYFYDNDVNYFMYGCYLNEGKSESGIPINYPVFSGSTAKSVAPMIEPSIPTAAKPQAHLNSSSRALTSAIDRQESLSVIREGYKKHFSDLGYRLLHETNYKDIDRDEFLIYDDFKIGFHRRAVVGTGKAGNTAANKTSVVILVDITCENPRRFEELTRKFLKDDKFEYINDPDKGLYIIRYILSAKPAKAKI